MRHSAEAAVREQDPPTTEWGGGELHHSNLHTCMKVAVMEGLGFKDKHRYTMTLIYIDDCIESHRPYMENLVFSLFKKKTKQIKTLCLCK